VLPCEEIRRLESNRLMFLPENRAGLPILFRDPQKLAFMLGPILEKEFNWFRDSVSGSPFIYAFHADSGSKRIWIPYSLLQQKFLIKLSVLT